MNKYLDLIRVKQWYKNILIFTALFFSFNLFNFTYFKFTVVGFIALCLVSSGGYVLNDIIDKNRDKLHPEKKKRPLPSGKVKVFEAFLISIVLYLIGFFIAYNLGKYFFISVISLSFFTFIYSIFLKNVVIADILLISMNFILRALSGVFIINVKISLWFLLAVLFLAIFLVSAKRYGDIILMGSTAKEYKPVLKLYSQDFLKTIITVSLTVLILIYGLYVYSINKFYLFYLYPVYIYILFRYLYLIYEGNKFIRNPENFLFKEKEYPLIISGILFCILFFLVYYYL